eukprot:CAMPEP_0202942842 /NCGR_PEP_ID=MMETSP1395-20130829/3087_1 /ASSEMBLY_ACC=CAM_ASM_000871 /TAXON_ID=5961 /ORGANISM="Blepharisma japonicum, Strain Stock R1072" /LENGTH=89 /DNA_ID=CAMNT_0049639563 /DNA_START=796 /DNA_END=1062 /DNA_ORIENTATION=-
METVFVTCQQALVHALRIFSELIALSKNVQEIAEHMEAATIQLANAIAMEVIALRTATLLHVLTAALQVLMAFATTILGNVSATQGMLE